MTKLYVDTNVFLDAILGRKNLTGKDIATPASKMFFRSISCEFHVVISTFTMEELYKQVDENDLKMLFQMIKPKIIFIECSSEDKQVARERSSENYDDALHIVMAEKEKADIIVTRNTSHFIQIGTKIPIKIPELL